jgi:YHS domain-containing protein
MKHLPPLLFFIILPYFSFAQNKEKTYNVNKNNIIIDGYDVVSYFATTPQKGRQEFTSIYDGVTFHFSSKGNKLLFEKSPEKYIPKYGGWCAYAIGNSNEKVTINPKTYKIINGELYLFYNKNLTNTLTLWNKNETELKNKANKNWLKSN